MSAHRPLTAEEVRALLVYRNAHGRAWKRKLGDWWQSGPVVQFEADRLLYCLRNTHGPSWLADFDLAAAERALLAAQRYRAEARRAFA